MDSDSQALATFLFRCRHNACSWSQRQIGGGSSSAKCWGGSGGEAHCCCRFNNQCSWLKASGCSCYILVGITHHHHCYIVQVWRPAPSTHTAPIPCAQTATNTLYFRPPAHSSHSGSSNRWPWRGRAHCSYSVVRLLQPKDVMQMAASVGGHIGMQSLHTCSARCGALCPRSLLACISG